jgi:hypothetical protein
MALGRGREFAAQQAQKRGFAAAVGADQADFHARGEDEVQAGEKSRGLFSLFGGVSVAASPGGNIAGYVVELDQPLGLALAGFEVDAGLC